MMLLAAAALAFQMSADPVVARALALLDSAAPSVPVVVVAGEVEHGGTIRNAFVHLDAERVIYVTANGATYRRAASGDRLGLLELASVIAHEQEHLQHGAEEAHAYAVQMACIRRLGHQLGIDTRALERLVREAAARATARP